MMGVHGKCKLENPCESFCLQKAWHAQFLRKEPRLRSRPFSWLASDVKASRNDHPTPDLQTTANRRLARSRLPGGLLPSSRPASGNRIGRVAQVSCPKPSCFRHRNQVTVGAPGLAIFETWVGTRLSWPKRRSTTRTRFGYHFENCSKWPSVPIRNCDYLRFADRVLFFARCRSGK
jgi:hypothetical protein